MSHKKHHNQNLEKVTYNWSVDGQKSITVVIGVMVVKDKKILMIERKSSEGLTSWSIPSGIMNFGESPEAAASKIVMEKVALVTGNLRLGALTNEFHEFEKKHNLTLWMLADWQGGEPVKHDQLNIVNLGWYDFDTLPQPLSNPWNGLLSSRFMENLRTELQ